MRTLSRAQCLVIRDCQVLMVQCQDADRVFWCLPGGGIEQGEAPADAALRELLEECCVVGHIVRETATTTYSLTPVIHHHTFLIDIGIQEPRLGHDPEYAADAQCMLAIDWRSLAQLSEKDRAFLWTAGLISLPEFAREALSWPADAAYPS